MAKDLVKVEDFSKELEQQEQKLIEAFPRDIDVKRFTRLACTAIIQNPALLECSKASLLKSIMEAAELGLSLDKRLGHGFLVPFYDKDTKRKQAQLIPGYKGLIFLALQSGKVDSISAEVVREGDEIEVELGLNEKLFHKPTGDFDNNIIAAYAIATLPNSRKQFVWVPRKHIDKIRDAAPSKNSPAWRNWFEAMCKKTAVNQLSDFLPLKELSMAVTMTRERTMVPFDNDSVEAKTADKAESLKEKIKKAKDITPKEAEVSEDEPEEEKGQVLACKLCDQFVMTAADLVNGVCAKCREEV